MTSPLLSIRDLHVTFQSSIGSVMALSGVNIDLLPKQTLGIVGESGCGKSATAKAILKLLPSHTTSYSGKIIYEGTNLLDLAENKLRHIRGKEIGMILQDPMTSLNPTMRIGDQIAESILEHGFVPSRSEALHKAKEMLHMVGITSAQERLLSFPHTLSGGQRQRVLIAIALACRPKILVADEPTTALDVTIQAQILSLLQEIKETMEMSIILITHDMSVIAGLCDKVAVMYAGKVIEIADVEELFYQPKHPYTQKLLSAIPSMHANKDLPLTPIEGNPPVLKGGSLGCAFTPRCPYAMKICAAKEPPCTSFTPSHEALCWLYNKPGG